MSDIDTVYQENRALEAEIKVLSRMAKRYGDELAEIHNTKHIVTKKMIDEAVALKDGHNIRTLSEVTLWAVLNNLGIFKCGGCEGCGHVPPAIERYARNTTGITCLDCAKWGSNGWVIREVGDE
jgi:hypothetical protein